MYVFTVDERDGQQAPDQTGADGRAGLKVQVASAAHSTRFLPGGNGFPLGEIISYT